ncbi:MAG: hypothetical protein OXI67_18835 [Candidatus Poribacteria bacterium]|nr:hypothetical protein [Candidatus Poribacteria bacterium]
MIKKIYWGLAPLMILIGTGVFLYVKAEQKNTVDAHIAAAEKLIIDGDYYEALLALEPLLTSKVKSETQEKALWIAHQLGEKVTKMVVAECDEIRSEVMKRTGNNILAGDARSQLYSEKVNPINQLGANILSNEMGTFYDKGFLRQLIDKYPDSPKRPFAEYHLFYSLESAQIEDSLEGVYEYLDVLHTYVEKYEKTGRAEVYMAYRDFAHINHGIWAMLTFPDDPGIDFNVVSSGDPEKDKQSAARHKAEALKYYALYQINPYGLPNETENFQHLKNNDAFGVFFLSGLWGC